MEELELVWMVSNNMCQQLKVGSVF